MCEYTQLTQWLHINSFILPQAKREPEGPAEIHSTEGTFSPVWAIYNEKLYLLLQKKKREIYIVWVSTMEANVY